MSYFRPLASITLVNKNALRSFSAMPPRNGQRTSGCISMSLSIGRSTRIRWPGAAMVVQVGVGAGGRGGQRFAFWLGEGVHDDCFPIVMPANAGIHVFTEVQPGRRGCPV